MIQNAMPVLFRAESCRVPTEIVNSHSPVRDRLISPQPNLPFLRLRRKTTLPGFSRLFFHDHEGLAALYTPGQIMAEGDAGRNEGGRARLALLRHQHVEKTGIVIERDEIQIRV